MNFNFSDFVLYQNTLFYHYPPNVHRIPLFDFQENSLCQHEKGIGATANKFFQYMISPASLCNLYQIEFVGRWNLYKTTDNVSLNKE